MRKIQNKIFVMFLFVIIIPLIIVSVYFTLHITRFIKQNELTELKRNTEIKVARTSYILGSAEKDIKSLASNVLLVNFIDALTEEDAELVRQYQHNLESMLKEFLENEGIYDQICYIDESGIETVRADLSHQGYADIVPYDKLQDISNRNYFKETVKLKEGNVYVSEHYIMREDGNNDSKGKPALRYATPVFDRKKRERGVLVFNVAANNLLESISGFNFIDGIESNLLDKHGNYLLHTDVSKIWSGISDNNPTSNIKSDLPQDVVNIVLEGKSGIKMVDNKFLSFIPIKYDSLNTGKYWVCFESLDASKVYSKIYTIYKIIGSLVLLLLAGIVTATIIFSMKITKPLKELVKGATAVAKQDFNYYIKFKSNDEFEFLIFSFNKMVNNLGKARKQLQNYTHNLEKKVADKMTLLKGKLKMSEVLVEVGQLLRDEEDINKTMDFIVHQISKTLNVTFCEILLLDKTDNSLCMVSGVGWNEGVVGKATVDVGLDSQMSYNLNELKPFIIKDLQSGIDFSTSPLLVEHGIVSGVSVPMVVGDHIIGVLGVYSDQLKEFPSDEINFLLSVGYIIASAIKSRRADKEIESKNEYTHSLIETAKDAIVCIDDKGVINIWNKSAEKVLGYSESEILGEKITKIIPEKYRKRDEEELKRFLKTGEFGVTGKTIDVHGINNRGIEIPIEMSLAVQKTEKEKTLFTVIIQDITEREKMKELEN